MRRWKSATRRTRRDAARCFEAYHAAPEEEPAVQLTIPQPVIAGNA